MNAERLLREIIALLADREKGHSLRITRRAMTASSQAVRSSSVAANGDHSSRMSGTSIVSRLAVSRVSISIWSWGRKATILVRISPSAVATWTVWPSVHSRGAAGERSGVEGEDRLEPVDANLAERERGHILPDVLLDNEGRVERETPLDEVIQQSGQDDLRDVEQEVGILSEPGTAAKHECQSANQCVTDRAGVERLGQDATARTESSGKRSGSAHDVR